MAKPMWTYKLCDDCEGRGLTLCLACERACDHDRLCGSCKGIGAVPKKIEPIVFLGVWFNRPSQDDAQPMWNTRREAQHYLDICDQYGNVRQLFGGFLIRSGF